MAQKLCPDASRRTIAVAAASVLLVYSHVWAQLLVIGSSAIAGLIYCRDVGKLPDQSLPLRYGPRLGGFLIVLFLLMLGGLPLIAYSVDGLIAVIEAFYRAGALVFGGGHVVLPLLKESVVRPGWLTADEFLAGYGAAQAVPGPMFTLAAYLGARLPGEMGGIAGAAAALLAIFLPGFLLVSGMLPLWHALTRHPLAASAVVGVNAAVVGLLGAALYNPIWISAIRGPGDVAIALTGFALLSIWRVSALFVVIWCVAVNVATILSW